MSDSVKFMAKKSKQPTAENNGEASCEVAAGVGEFFQNRLKLDAHLMIGINSDDKIEFSIAGGDMQLSKLLYVMLKMAPPAVVHTVAKLEMAKSMKDFLHEF